METKLLLLSLAISSTIFIFCYMSDFFFFNFEKQTTKKKEPVSVH